MVTVVLVPAAAGLETRPSAPRLPSPGGVAWRGVECRALPSSPDSGANPIPRERGR